jgi:hypothetical protein
MDPKSGHVDLSGLFADGGSFVVGALDGQPFVAARGDIIVSPTGEPLIPVSLTPEIAAETAANLLVVALACCEARDGSIDAKRQEAVRAMFEARVAELSVLLARTSLTPSEEPNT